MPVGVERDPRANTFFALLPPSSTRTALVALQRRLAAQLPAQARPVAPDNLHLTLAFLGAVRRSRLASLRSVAGALPPGRWTLRLDRLGAFPRARVAWLGPSAVDRALAAWQARLSSALMAAGFEPDRRPWAPHLTLYRNLRTPLPRLAVEPVEWVCEAIVLLRTEPGEDGPRYRRLGRWTAPSVGE